MTREHLVEDFGVPKYHIQLLFGATHALPDDTLIPSRENIIHPLHSLTENLEITTAIRSLSTLPDATPVTLTLTGKIIPIIWTVVKLRSHNGKASIHSAPRIATVPDISD